jgi:FMN phosphatase YigB (HAD superfamily)
VLQSILTGVNTTPADVAFLLDVDNTLLNNDQVIEDLRRFLVDAFGAEHQRRYWDILETCRRELGYVDYLGALQRYRAANPRDQHPLSVSRFLLRYPFADRLYPRALEVISAMRQRGPTVILSDGDVVFQPHKIERAGLWAAVAGEVLIYVHKEQMLDDVALRYPATHYVMVDDKLVILAAMKAIWGGRLTTVFVRQGHYARDARQLKSPPADISIDSLDDLIDRGSGLIIGDPAIG